MFLIICCADHTQGMPGYRKHYVSSPPEELLCTSCQLVARDPHRSKCKCDSQLYCQMCIRELQHRSSLCSTCFYTLESFADSLSARHIRAIKVECDNREAGCEWKGQLGELLDSHLQSCPLHTVECPYADVGCSVRVRRQEAEQHSRESTEQHLQLAAGRIQRLEAVAMVPPVVFKLAKFNLKKAKNERWNSPKFFSHRGGYRLCLSIDANGNGESKGSHISIYVRLTKSLSDPHLVWPFRGELTIDVLNQLEDGTHFSKSILFDWKESDVRNSVVTNPEASSRGWGYHDFIPHSMLDYSAVNNTHYLKDDTLFVRVSKVVVYETNKPWLTPTLTE